MHILSPREDGELAIKRTGRKLCKGAIQSGGVPKASGPVRFWRKKDEISVGTFCQPISQKNEASIRPRRSASQSVAVIVAEKEKESYGFYR
jgi:hypothetical protein